MEQQKRTTIVQIGESSRYFVRAQSDYIDYGLNQPDLDLNGETPVSMSGWFRFSSIVDDMGLVGMGNRQYILRIVNGPDRFRATF